MSWHPCRQIAKSQNAWFTVLSVIIGALCNRGHWFHHDITPSSSLAWIAIIISICSTLSIPVLHNPAYTEARMILLDSKSDHVTQTLKGLQHTFLPQFPRPSMVWPLTPSPTCPPSLSPLLTTRQPHLSPCLSSCPPCILRVCCPCALLLNNSSSRELDPENGCFSLSRESELPFLCFFLLFRPSKDWMMPSHIDEDDIYPAYWLKCYSLLETPSQGNKLLPAAWASLRGRLEVR